MTARDPRDYWDGEAATFDDEPDHGLADPRAYAAWRRLLEEHLPPPPGSVADVGCGTGTLSVLVAQLGHSVVGLDLSPAMVKRARAKATTQGVDARFEIGDASQPTLPAASFDAVVVRHVLWALPDPGLALDRWLTLLRPGGRLILVEGLWGTGSGLAATEVVELLEARAAYVHCTQLTDAVYWGKDIDDERYLITAG